MSKIKKHINDKFYTKPEVAIHLISYLNIDQYDIVIEPSAGNGSFSNNINHKNLIKLDIEPENDDIIKMNWFDFTLVKNGKILVVGNPPFGTQGKLAFEFIKKCDQLEIHTISFILPKSFKKDSIKNRIPEYYHLINEINIEDNSFTLLNKDYSVPSVFQIWERKEYKRKNIILKTKSELITFVKKTDNPDYSFRRVGFYAGKIYDDKNKSEQSHYFIKSTLEVKEFLINYIWKHDNTTGPRSIGKSEIVKIIEDKFL